MPFEISHDVLKKYEGNETRVIIPEGIREIADYAFYGAHAMEYISIPSSVKEIGTNAFYDCASLKEAVLPDSLFYLGSAAFGRCFDLKRVWLPDSLTSLPRIAFFQCERLEQIRLPETITRIGRACFEKCRSLHVIVLPETLRILEDNVFDECTQLEAVFLPENLEEIGNNVFIGCENLAEITLGKNVRKIGTGAFETGGSLKLNVPEETEIRPQMLDNRWNMDWRTDTPSRLDEKKYLLHDSYIPSLRLNEWKPLSRVVLAVNYLETYRGPLENYETWIHEHTQELLEMIVSSKRYEALNKALANNILDADLVQPYLYRINDRDEKAKLLEMSRNQKKKDDLLSMDLDDLF